MSSKNSPPVPPVPSSESCSSQCEQEQVSGSDSVPNSFFLFLSTSFFFLFFHEKHKEKFSSKEPKEKSQTGLRNPRKFSGQRKTEQLQSAVQLEVRSSAEERVCRSKPLFDTNEASVQQNCWEEEEKAHRLLGASADDREVCRLLFMFL